MFARLLKQNSATSPFGRHAPHARPSFAVPRHHLNAQQLEHLIAYWASGKPHATTATVKGTLFRDHLRIKLATDEKFETALHEIAGRDQTARDTASAILNIFTDAAFTALKNARPHPVQIPADGRYGVGLKAFDQELCDNLKAITDKKALHVMHKTGFDRIRSLTTDALKRTAHEVVLTEQLRTTARQIEKMEAQKTAGTLPPEDAYELRLREELFIADHTLYVKITRAAVDQVRLIGPSHRIESNSPPAPHHVLSCVFGTVSLAAKSAFHLIRDITGSRVVN